MSRYALIIEDDPKLGKVFCAALKAAGYETSLDADGNRYTELLAARHPDLILLDMHLPFASGVDIFDELRADERWSSIPIVVMTADVNIANMLDGHADRVLLKPVSVSRIQETALSLMAD